MSYPFSPLHALTTLQQYLQQFSRPTDTESLPIHAALCGRCLAEPLLQRQGWPPESRSTVDGIALQSSDSIGASDLQPLPLSLTEKIAALKPGEGALLQTGDPLPPCATAVLPLEMAEIFNDLAMIRGGVADSENVLLAHSEGQAGDNVLPVNHRLRAVDLPWLLQQQIEELKVYRRPCIRILSDHPSDGTGMMVAARLATLDIEVISHKTLSFPSEEVADLWLTIGRCSAGPNDIWPQNLAKVGKLALHGVALRPALPSGVGQFRGCPVVLLPGQPVSACCALDLLVLPLLRDWLQIRPPIPEWLPLRRKISSAPGFDEYWRVKRKDDGLIPIATDSASRLMTLVQAAGFVHITAMEEGFSTGHLLPFFAY